MGDIANIKPGSKVSVKVVNIPTNAAARKTIARILSKDKAVHAENIKQSRIRRKNYSPAMRGGRLYSGRVVKQHPVKGERGESGVVLATMDVIRDLQSVRRFVEVGSARQN